KVKLLHALLRPNPPDTSMETPKFATSTPRGSGKLATILWEEAKKLLAIAMSSGRCRGANSRSGPSMRHELEPRPRQANVTRIGESLQSSAWLTKLCKWRERAGGANSRPGRRRRVRRKEGLIVRIDLCNQKL